MPTALITGICGQDGAYLAQHLLGLGYRVVGLARPTSSDGRAWRLRALGIANDMEIRDGDVLDPGSLRAAMAAADPDEVYNLAAVSSPRACAEVPALAIRVAGEGALNVIEAAGRERRVFQAGSLADYPNANGPYAIGKAAASGIVRHFRSRGYWVAEARMGNHESPLRSGEFVCQQIARAAARGERMQLRDPGAVKDIGWAPEFVQRMHEMLQLESPIDRIFKTGVPCTLGEFQNAAHGWLHRLTGYVHDDPAYWYTNTIWQKVAQRMVEAARA